MTFNVEVLVGYVSLRFHVTFNDTKGFSIFTLTEATNTTGQMLLRRLQQQDLLKEIFKYQEDGTKRRNSRSRKKIIPTKGTAIANPYLFIFFFQLNVQQILFLIYLLVYLTIFKNAHPPPSRRVQGCHFSRLNVFKRGSSAFTDWQGRLQIFTKWLLCLKILGSKSSLVSQSLV